MEPEGWTLPPTQASPEAPHPLAARGAFLAPLSYLPTGDPAHPLRLGLKLDLAARPAFPKSSLLAGRAGLRGVTHFSEAGMRLSLFTDKKPEMCIMD